ncbi:MAG TPA: hypothetical protein DDX54_06860 [Rhodospirillaceae bacterium]|jgi:flagellin|nr:hypothetical protein [Alphaproteobacteria bacterium]HBH27104.1 hypothetical protein [Rhodospirillaceae bacterium]
MATSNVALSGSLRANLQALQNTQSLFDRSSNILATGRDVNSVFDDPINFISASRLNDQSSDLGRLLDGISLSLRTIEAADNAAIGVESLLDNAQAIIDSASDELSGSNRAASITANKDLRAFNDLTDIQGIGDGDILRISVTDPDSTGASLTDSDVTISTNDSLEDLVAEINSKNDALSEDVVAASITSDGGLKIEAADGRELRVELVADATLTDTSAEFALAEALGFSDVFVEEDVLNGTSKTAAITVSSGATIDSDALLASGVVASRTTLISDLDNFAGIDNAGDTLTLRVNNQQSTLTSASSAFVLNGASVENLVDHVNTDSNLKTLISASFDESTGKISIRALDDSVTGVVFDFDSNVPANAADLDLDFGFGTGVTDDDTGVSTTNDVSEYVRFGASAGAVLALETQYNDLLTQIDSLVADASFQGVNLLNGDNLTTYFRADRSSSLTTEGTDFTSAQLGLSEANFVSQSAITSFTNERLAATETVRAFGETLTNSLNIIQTRQTFAESTIDTLEGAADDLTLANLEEESAKLLALQTRQQLGTVALSLASQASQSVLRLF